MSKKRQSAGTTRAGSAYAQAGVDIDKMMSGLSAIKKMVKSTATDDTLGSMGSFGGLFRSPGKHQVLVASTDGVGTKLKVAAMANRHTTVGQDLVNHCVNDILVQGAEPLFFMDYLGTSQLRRAVFHDIVSGLCKACRQNGCALLGGETAEMPGLYPPREYDLVGTIVGTVKKADLITGHRIRPGDVVIGLKASGLHTNGYSLARRIVFEKCGMKIGDTLPGTRKTVANVLLAVHRSYLKPVTRVMQEIRIHGMAHITGGGVFDNIPRVLPPDTEVVLDRRAWQVPAVFRFIQERGSVDPEEMYRVFNMGIGFVLIVRQADASRTIGILRKTRSCPTVIGRVKRGDGSLVLK